mmetsp:Transcript_62429/g.115914  ORF Transcript_62429/g.115914 Transcript_62429/m.115914 type:complete len:301 (-) Transcript_62429:25-927(-)
MKSLLIIGVASTCASVYAWMSFGAALSEALAGSESALVGFRRLSWEGGEWPQQGGERSPSGQKAPDAFDFNFNTSDSDPNLDLDGLFQALGVVGAVAAWMPALITGTRITLALLPFGIAAIYLSRVTSKRQTFVGSKPSSGEFVTHYFGCFDNCNYCILGCCCFAARAGDTVHTVGVAGFWTVVLFTAGIDILMFLIGQAIPSLSPYVVFLLCRSIRGGYMATLRAKVRGAIGRDPVCNAADFFLWCLCGCCAVIQEAKEVDLATSTAVIPCCCVLESAPDNKGGTIVGMPVRTTDEDDP